jgi:general stress protein CsbA
VYKKWLAVVLGVLAMACAAFFGYTYLQGDRVITVSDLSLVEPGLNLRSLHQQGCTGKGIHVAIIDGPLIQ